MEGEMHNFFAAFPGFLHWFDLILFVNLTSLVLTLYFTEISVKLPSSK